MYLFSVCRVKNVCCEKSGIFKRITHVIRRFSSFFGLSLLPPQLLRDRFRTVTNVLGDSIGAGIVEHLSRHELLKKDPELCSSVVEEVPKKSYHLVCQENECENQARPDSETKM